MVSGAAADIDPLAEGVLSYLINSYQVGGASVPYSVGTGIGPRAAARLGVDVPGESLSNVIVTRLPFAVPDHPVIESKLEAIREEGGNPFTDFSVPEAVIKLRQGVGRLIRSKKDSGLIVILDNRVVTKPYGKSFLAALPDTPVKIVT